MPTTLGAPGAPNTTNPTPVPPAAPSSSWPGATWSTYNPAAGTDPEWDAYVAQFTHQVTQRNAEADLQRKRLQTEYDAGIAKLALDAPGARSNLETSLLARGVGRSGEAIQRRSGLEAEMLGQQDAADRARLEGYAALDSSLTGSLGDLAAEREAKIAESRLRLLAKNKAVDTVGTPGAAGGSGYAPPKKAKAPIPAKKPAAPAGNPYQGSPTGGTSNLTPTPPPAYGKPPPAFKPPKKVLV